MIFRDYGTTGDGLVAALQILRIIKSRGTPLSQLAKCWTRFPQLVTNVKVREKKPFAELDGVNQLVADAEKELSAQGGRLLLRYSGTEPKVRLLVEGRDAESAGKLVPKNLRRDSEADWDLSEFGLNDRGCRVIEIRRSPCKPNPEWNPNSTPQPTTQMAGQNR